jgi:hypothetical protein
MPLDARVMVTLLMQTPAHARSAGVVLLFWARRRELGFKFPNPGGARTANDLPLQFVVAILGSRRHRAFVIISSWS